MNVLDRITGFSRYEQALEPQLLSLTLESQRVRVFPSHKALWLVNGRASTLTTNSRAMAGPEATTQRCCSSSRQVFTANRT